VAEVSMESRIRVELDGLSFVTTVEEGYDLLDQLTEVLPLRDAVRRSIGFGMDDVETDENSSD
jgi:hypothetical protein